MCVLGRKNHLTLGRQSPCLCDLAALCGGSSDSLRKCTLDRHPDGQNPGHLALNFIKTREMTWGGREHVGAETPGAVGVPTSCRTDGLCIHSQPPVQDHFSHQLQNLCPHKAFQTPHHFAASYFMNQL